MKKVVTCVLIFPLLSLVHAHEFWLFPSKFRYNVGEKLVIDFMSGENFEGDFWDMQKHNVEKLMLYNRLSETNLTGKESKTLGKNLEYTFNNVGTHLVALQSNVASIEMEPEAFETYLSENGLEYVKGERQKRGEEGKPAKELYARYAKLLIQVGGRTDDTFKRQTGLKYEIVPLQNPYELKAGDYLDCRIFYRGQPEPHALVKVWNHIGNRTFLQNIYTEKDGSIRFPVSNSGSWMVSSVKLIRSNSEKVEWESMWGSLVFGIE